MQATLSRPISHHSASVQPAVIDSSSAALEASVDSANLLRGKKSVTIVHNGAIYRLQATKLGKLILTK